MDKPTKVEVGQRWRCDDGDASLRGKSFAIVSLYGDGQFSSTWEHGIRGCGSVDWLREACSFLGHGPQEAKAHTCDCYRVENCKSAPHKCGGCGGWCAGAAPKVEEPAPVSEACSNKFGCGCSKHYRFSIKDWRRVERDRRPDCEVAESPTGAFLAKVGNVTALQLIQSRKPPEPWRPSVDDWDLLPDAGR